MKKMLSVLALTALLAIGLSSPARALDVNQSDASSGHRLMAFGTGLTTAYMLDHGITALTRATMPDDKTPVWARRLVVATLTMMTVMGVEAARQAGANENGLDFTNVAAGTAGALVGFSFSW